MQDVIEAKDLPSSFPVGRVIVFSSAMIVVVFCIMNAIWTPSHQLDWSMIMLGFLLGSELIWGSKWSRWVTGIWMLLIFVQMVLTVIQNPSWDFFHLLTGFYMVIGVFGMGLIFHKQVGPFLKIRRDLVAFRHKNLKNYVRVVVVLGLLVTVALDVRYVLLQSSG